MGMTGGIDCVVTDITLYLAAHHDPVGLLVSDSLFLAFLVTLAGRYEDFLVPSSWLSVVPSRSFYSLGPRISFSWGLVFRVVD